MRVLLSTIGSRGDVQPLVALALEIRSLGEDVRLVVPPDFREWIEGLGLDVITIGPNLRAATTTPPSTRPTPGAPSADRRRQMAEGTVAAQFETITAAARGCDIIVAATALQIAARSIAEEMGIPYVFAAYAPNVLPSAHHAPPRLPPVPGQPPEPATADTRELWARDAARFHDLFAGALNVHRAARGLAPVDDVRGYMFTSRPWLAVDPTLGPWPEDEALEVFQPGAWILPDDRPLTSELAAFLDRGEPPVYFGFGSMRPPQGLDPVALRVEAARAVGRRLIVSAGWAEISAAARGDDCLVIKEANLQALFPRVAAVVHHGGAGTTTLAALAGAAQVVIPQGYDQPYWARQVEDLGIGTAIATGEPSAASLASALDRALAPAVAARAPTNAAAVRRDGTRRAVDRLVGRASGLEPR
jgi:vancomycin aglycone glucosyltransferase